MPRSVATWTLVFCLGNGACSNQSDDADAGDGTDAPEVIPQTVDPGTGAWEPVARDQLAEVCGLDADLLDEADASMTKPYAIVRYGRLCHEFYPEAFGHTVDTVAAAWSATKTLGAAAFAAAVHQTRMFERTGPGTGPLSDEDRVDHWLDSFSFNEEATLAHVLSMVAHNADLSEDRMVREYDANGDVQIDRIGDVIRAAIAQDSDRLGADLDQFSKRFLFEPLGMRTSTWDGSSPGKRFGFSWSSNVRDMARLGLLLLNDGVWNGERLLDAEIVYRMGHPTFEAVDTGYGYLSWLGARANWTFAGIDGRPPSLKQPRPSLDCMPAAIWKTYPHGVSEAEDCGYGRFANCDNEYDVGAWSAQGRGGQYIIMMKGLDLVLILREAGENGITLPWIRIRPAIIAHDPVYADDPEGFCTAYAGNRHAPDL